MLSEPSDPAVRPISARKASSRFSVSCKTADNAALALSCAVLTDCCPWVSMKFWAMALASRADFGALVLVTETRTTWLLSVWAVCTLARKTLRVRARTLEPDAEPPDSNSRSNVRGLGALPLNSGSSISARSSITGSSTASERNVRIWPSMTAMASAPIEKAGAALPSTRRICGASSRISAWAVYWTGVASHKAAPMAPPASVDRVIERRCRDRIVRAADATV